MLWRNSNCMARVRRSSSSSGCTNRTNTIPLEVFLGACRKRGNRDFACNSANCALILGISNSYAHLSVLAAAVCRLSFLSEPNLKSPSVEATPEVSDFESPVLFGVDKLLGSLSRDFQTELQCIDSLSLFLVDINQIMLDLQSPQN